MRVLLTGASGFIGKRLTLDLLEAGHEVRGSVRSAKKEDEVRDAVRPHLSDPALLEQLSFVHLDLTRDEGWAEALDGVDALMHTASPFPIAAPKDPETVIRPAVDGTLRAMNAAWQAGVHRVILTSSVAAIMNKDLPNGHELTEADWSEEGHPALDPYSLSKTLAERAAWEFAVEHPEMRLTVICPGLVLGTPVDKRWGTSLELIERVMKRKILAVPNFGMPIVDVADVSAMHVKALETPKSAGHRYIAAAGFAMMPKIVGWLAEEFPKKRIPTRRAPNWAVRLTGRIDPAARVIAPILGRRLKIDNAAARRDLGVRFTNMRDAAIASAKAVASA